MSTSGFYQDSPYKITTEGREISISFQKTSPTTATVNWTLPKGAPGCSIDDLVYNGIVVVVDNVPIKIDQTPSNQTYYNADNTVDRDLHSGDTIGTGLVVAALYDDKSTVSIELTGLIPNTPYYFAGFAVDNVGNYHAEGVHSYSQEYQEKSTSQDSAGCQQVLYGISSSDLTSLDPLTTYSIRVTFDGKDYDFNILGSNASTYQHLVDYLNTAIKLYNNPHQDSVPPLANSLFVNTQKRQVFVWTGFGYEQQDVLDSSFDPLTPSLGAYWKTTNKLFKWNSTDWIDTSFINFGSNPITTFKCNDKWFNGSYMFSWSGINWNKLDTIIQPNDPTPQKYVCGTYWIDPSSNELNIWTGVDSKQCDTGSWVPKTYLEWNSDPTLISNGLYWYNTTTSRLLERISSSWNTPLNNVVYSEYEPSPIYLIGTLWVNQNTLKLYRWDGTEWVELINSMIIFHKDPTFPEQGDYYFDGSNLYNWNSLYNHWDVLANGYIQVQNPWLTSFVDVDTIWFNGTSFFRWDGIVWIDETINIIVSLQDPNNVILGSMWYNNVSNTLFEKQVSGWINVTYINFPELIQTSNITTGTYWLNNLNTLSVWNGMSWVSVLYSSTPISYPNGTLWYNNSDKILYSWNKTKWDIYNVPHVSINELGHLVFTSGTTGSTSSVNIVPIPGSTNPLLTSYTIPAGQIQIPLQGTDSVLPTPSYLQMGVGTDGSSEERREMVETILIQLGYPTVQVELTKQQLEFCVDQGLQNLRRMSSSAYERVYFFLQFRAGQQHYILSDKTVGFHKVVNVLGMRRTSSAFLGTAEGQGVYGQIVLQHLYQMGNFDLVSYHVISDYIELLEKMFASNIMYSWNEKQRRLSIQQNIWKDEKVLLDAVIERTEQDILADRYLNNWIRQWATGEACMILAEVRGKYSSLPGASGSVTLNASDLRTRAEKAFEQCKYELENYIANSNIETIGGTQFIMG